MHEQDTLLSRLQELGDAGEEVAYDASEEIVSLRATLVELQDRFDELAADKETWFRMCDLHCRRLSEYQAVMRTAMSLLDPENPVTASAYVVLHTAIRDHLESQKRMDASREQRGA